MLPRTGELYTRFMVYKAFYFEKSKSAFRAHFCWSDKRSYLPGKIMAPTKQDEDAEEQENAVHARRSDILYSDLSSEQVQEALKVANEGLDKKKVEKDMATDLKRRFEEMHPVRIVLLGMPSDGIFLSSPVVMWKIRKVTYNRRNTLSTMPSSQCSFVNFAINKMRTNPPILVMAGNLLAGHSRQELWLLLNTPYQDSTSVQTNRKHINK